MADRLPPPRHHRDALFVATCPVMRMRMKLASSTNVRATSAGPRRINKDKHSLRQRAPKISHNRLRTDPARALQWHLLR
eukprot:9140329-Pyramimonas_sp.AAC.1